MIKLRKGIATSLELAKAAKKQYKAVRTDRLLKSSILPRLLNESTHPQVIS